MKKAPTLRWAEAAGAAMLALLATGATAADKATPDTPLPEIAVPDIEGDVEWGQFLAAECATCHRAGSDASIPDINGWPEPVIAYAMHAYRAGLLPNPTMQTIARRLSDDEIAALAAWYALQDPKNGG